MSGPRDNATPTLTNRRASHDYDLLATLECGIALLGSEVKSLRQGKAQLTDSFARIERGRLVLHNCHIDPYDKSGGVSHEPKRARFLLAHKREIRRLESECREKSVTLIPLRLYFKNGRAKVELAVARGRQAHDKRDSIRRKEQEKEIRRATSIRPR